MTASDMELNRAGAATEQILAEAVNWVERADREDWTSDGKDALDRWLTTSSAHAVAFLRARDGWRRADRLVALRGTLEPSRPNATARNGSLRIRAGGGVLVVALLIAASFMLTKQARQSDAYSTGIGGHKSMILADGSHVELNTDTSIRIRLNEHRRTVWIDRGEVYFQVAHNAANPFVVLAGGHRITDLGTKFVVRRGTSEVQVTLIEGRAEFAMADGTGDQRKILTPGDVAVATSDTLSVLKQTRQAVDNDLSWRRGVLVFDRTSLADAAAELNRYNTQKIIVADEGAAQERIEGTFPANNVELFGRVAKSVLGLQVQQQGNNIVISR